ncbi:hypothetical protein [Agrococcus baldri]|uniref:Uncharacterized protein n=1 Tax=Agrococcus baldri TaxID=153730 RepID=A0AA87RBP0_9MICO|nr:hypothetical protein [Agrococcus baldri]GEK80135.1 hypothetical protein ABA31_14860 [Agrococcus baldri]
MERDVSPQMLLKDLVSLRGRDGISYRAVEMTRVLPWIRVVSSLLRDQGRSEQERNATALEVVKCAAQNEALLGKSYSRIVTHTLNIAGEDSVLKQRMRDLLDEFKVGEKALARKVDYAYAELAMQLLVMTESPCDSWSAAARGLALAEEEAALLVRLAQIRVERAGGIWDVERTLQNLERHVPIGLQRFDGQNNSGGSPMRSILSKIIVRLYGPRVRFPELDPLFSPRLLRNLLRMEPAELSQESRRLATQMRDVMAPSFIFLDERAVKYIPWPTQESDVIAMVNRGLLLAVEIALALEESNEWWLLDDVADGERSGTGRLP